jgi:hypothetical protein
MSEEMKEMPQEKQMSREEFYEALKVIYKDNPDAFTVEMKAIMALFSMGKIIDLEKKKEEMHETMRKNYVLAEQLVDEYVLTNGAMGYIEFNKKYFQLLPTGVEDTSSYVFNDADLSMKITMLGVRYLKAVGVEVEGH